jgi:hypothetical protein
VLLVENEKLALKIVKKRMNSNFLDEEKIYHKTKLLLKIYRDVVWSVQDRLYDIEEEFSEMGGCCLREELDYLNDYDPNVNKKEIEDQLSSILKSKILIEIVDKALVKLKEYPDYGDLYFDILYKQYIVKFSRAT